MSGGALLLSESTTNWRGLTLTSVIFECYSLEVGRVIDVIEGVPAAIEEGKLCRGR